MGLQSYASWVEMSSSGHTTKLLIKYIYILLAIIM
jgi:hypothetical protein